MSFSRYTFNRVWTNPAQFPTYEENEEQVRADMQDLFDELLAFLQGDSNASPPIVGLIAELERHDDNANNPSGASGIGVNSINTLPGCSDVQSALALLAYQVSQAALGDIPDYSLVASKLSRKTDEGGAAVTEDAIAAGAVGTTELADAAVTDAKCDFSAGLTVPGLFKAEGGMKLDSDTYGDNFPGSPVNGQIFFKKVT